jgi:hypothetical protein
MSKLFSANQTVLKELFAMLNKLRDEGVLLNKKDFTCQIGEWLAETIFDGKRATNGIQKGWDVEIKGKFIQVKAHAKKQETTTGGLLSLTKPRSGLTANYHRLYI